MSVSRDLGCMCKFYFVTLLLLLIQNFELTGDFDVLTNLTGRPGEWSFHRENTASNGRMACMVMGHVQSFEDNREIRMLNLIGHKIV